MIRCAWLWGLSAWCTVAPLSIAAEVGTTRPEGPVAEAKPAAREGFYLLVDHLSPALYEGEPFTACLRVENTTEQEAEVEVRAEALGTGEKVLKTERRALQVAARGQASCRFDVGMAEIRSVRFSCHAPGRTLKGPWAMAVRSDEAWPETKVADGLLVEAESGRVVLPVVARCERREERSFAPLSWLVPGQSAATKAPGSAFVFVPAGWIEGSVELAEELLPAKTCASKAWARLGPYPLRGVAPVLQVIGDCARALPHPAPERAVVLLPAEDLDAATDPRLFRIALEVLIARLELAGVKDAVISSPLLYGVSTEQVELLARAAKEATVGRAARLFDRHGLMDEAFWRLDAKTPGVYGRRPNTAGRKMIRQALTDLIP